MNRAPARMLVLAAVLILALTWQLAKNTRNETAANTTEDINANRAESSR